MKKLQFLSFVLSVFVGGSALGQEFYLRAGLGYAFPLAGQAMYDNQLSPTGYNGSRTLNTNGSQSYNIKNASFSSGLQSVIGLGYMFTENIGVQLDAGIGLSNTKYTFNDNNEPLNVNGSTIPYDISTIQQAKTPIFLMPSLVLQTNKEKMNLYMRMGFALPLNTKVTQDQVYTNAPGTGALSIDDFTWQIKSSFSLGFTAAAGVKYKISDRVSVWGELSLLAMSANTKEQDITSWVENGQTVPSTYQYYPQNIKYSKTATVDSSLTLLPTYSQPFSNLGFNFGITFTLSHHESARRGGDDLIDDGKPFRRRN